MTRSASHPPTTDSRKTPVPYTDTTASPSVWSTEAAAREGVGEVVDEDGAHPVVAEPLPQLGGEQRHEAEGMAEEPAVATRGGGLRSGFRRRCRGASAHASIVGVFPAR